MRERHDFARRQNRKPLTPEALAWILRQTTVEQEKPLTADEALILIDSVIDTLLEAGNGVTNEMLHQDADKLFAVRDRFIEKCQPCEITDEQAISHLQSTGWMQNHDREMYESGLKERLADDSESYDSLIPGEDGDELDEAIRHCEAMAERGKDYAHFEYICQERRQLASWLRELRELREQGRCKNCVNKNILVAQMKYYGFHAPDMTITEFAEDLFLECKSKLCEAGTQMSLPECEDAVSREDVIKAFSKLLAERCGGNAISWMPVVEMVANELTSVTSKPRTGEWIDKGDYDNGEYGSGWHIWECDQCHAQLKEPLKYCPNCGSKNGGNHERSDS